MNEYSGRLSGPEQNLSISSRRTTPGISDPRYLKCASALSQAFDWVSKYLAHFDPTHPDRQFDTSRTKAFIEFAVMLRSYVAVTGDWSSPGVRRAVELLEVTLRNGRFVDRLLRSPAALVPLLQLYIAHRIVIGENPELRTLIQRVVAHGLEGYAGLSPYRTMEARMCLDWVEIHHSLVSWDCLHADSVLVNVPSPLYLREEDIYTLTHMVMFVTRYGLDPSAPPNLVNLERVRDLLSDLIVAMCQENHWDLLGELLFCWECLRFASSAIYERAWDALFLAQNEDGSFPPPAAAARRYNDRASLSSEIVEPEHRAFALSYHTTLVAIIAGCCRLQRAGASSLIVDSFEPSPHRSGL